MTPDLTHLALSAVGGLLGLGASLALRVYGADKAGAARLLGEVVQRLERSQSEALLRIASMEARLRELEVEQGKAGASQAALDARLADLRTDFRATSEKLDTISQLLAGIRSQLELITESRARPAR